MQKKFNILVALALIFGFEYSFAAKEVIFREQTHVYSKRNPNSKVLRVYDRGDTVPISSKIYGRWRKVYVDENGKKRPGWVLKTDIKSAKIKTSKPPKAKSDHDNAVIANYRKGIGLGVMGNLSYIHQTKGDITFSISGVDANATYSSMTGANVFTGVFADFNYSKTTAYRVYLAKRNMKRSGIAEVGGQSGNFTLTQDLMSLGVTLKFYKSANAIFWWGPGLEIAKTTEISMSGSAGALSVEGPVAEEPTYALLTLSAGYDFNLSKSFFVLPEVKFGIVPNGDPTAITLEFLIPLAMTF